MVYLYMSVYRQNTWSCIGHVFDVEIQTGWLRKMNTMLTLMVTIVMGISILSMLLVCCHPPHHLTLSTLCIVNHSSKPCNCSTYRGTTSATPVIMHMGESELENHN